MSDPSVNHIRDAVSAAIEAHQNEIIEAGEWIWRNPEPGYREVKTSAYLVERLRALGLEVKTGLAITGFRADIDTGRPGPTVAILCEMDSLILPNHPECDKETGAVHACGHHTSGAALIGTVIGLLAVKDQLCGRIALIGTPAEEGIELDYRKTLIAAGKIKSIAGKAQLIREGVFDDVDVAFMNHNSDSFSYHDHNGCVNKKITFYGKSCHAATPQSGKNALNASALAQAAIGLLRESLGYDPYFRIHGIITNGGSAVNIIPDEVSMEYMLRAPTVEKIIKLNTRFDNIVLHAAKAAECEAEVETVSGYMPLYDDNEFGAMMGDVVRYLRPDAAFYANTCFATGCTDMGDVATVIPAVHGYVPGGGGTFHGIDYRVVNKYDAYVINAKVQAILVADLLSGDGEKGRKIAAHKKDLMPIPEYIRLIDSLNGTVRSEDL